MACWIRCYINVYYHYCCCYNADDPFSSAQVTDPKLYEQIKYCVTRQLRRCQMIHEFVRELGKDVRWHGHTEDEASHYCNNCEVSILLECHRVVISFQRDV